MTMKQLPAPQKQNALVPLPQQEPPQAFLSQGYTNDHWQVLTKQFFPQAKTAESVMLVASYCKARKLDIMSKPFHIVPFYQDGKEVDQVLPGVNLYEITAHRTGQFAGSDAPQYGPEKNFIYRGKAEKKNHGKEHVQKSPEWCRVTVYRTVDGQKHGYTGEVWYQEYVSIVKSPYSDNCGYPNDNWRNKPRMMMSKCALAAALRLAFPEECGAEPTAEEMEGQSVYTSEDYESKSATEKDLINDPATQAMASAGRGLRKASAKPAETVVSVSQQEESGKVVDAEVVSPTPRQHEPPPTAGTGLPQQEAAASTTDDSERIIDDSEWAALLVAAQPKGWTSLDLERISCKQFKLPEGDHKMITVKQATVLKKVVTKYGIEILQPKETQQNA